MNITLIGMPSCGKSTVGVILAKRIGCDFVDCDLLIQKREKRLLRDIIREDGLERFLDIEAEVNRSLDVENCIIAPGGSVCLRAEAMEHLKEISTVIYLKITYEEMSRRIGDPVKRGVVLRPNNTLRDMYEERTALYEKYADLVIDEAGMSAVCVVDEIVEQLTAKSC